MAIDRKLIQQIKQACARIKRAGISIGMEKLAGPFRGQPILPRRQQRQQYQAPAPQQQYRAPAPQQQAPAPQAPLGENAGPLPSYEGNQASSDAYKQAPAGMQRFRNSATGEVFYAPNGQVANQYTAGGNAASLGIKPGERAGSQTPSPQQNVADQAMARDQEMYSGPAAGLDNPSAPLSGMDAAIAESKKIRAADPRNTAATLPAPAAKPPADDPSLRFNPKMTPLTQGANRPVHGSSGQPNFINAIKNVGTMAGNAGGNALKAVGTAGPGTGMPGGYNPKAQGKPEFSASPAASLGNLLRGAGNAISPSNAGSLNVPERKVSGGRNY